MDSVINFKKNTVKTRDYVFNREQMKIYGIVGVYNTVFDRREVGPGYVENYMLSVTDIDNGEVCIVEQQPVSYKDGDFIDENIRVASVIIFQNAMLRGLYMIAFRELYYSIVSDKSMGGLMN